MIRRFIIGLVIDAVGLMLISYLLQPNVMVNDFWSAILVAFGLSIVNNLIRPVVNLLALPINFLTFGLFRLVINGLMFSLVATMFPASIAFASFGYAMLTAIFFAIYHWLFEKVTASF